MMLRPFLLSPDDNGDEFPDVELALRDPNGLLAIGGNLSPERLLSAYTRGIFPWFNDDQPILWWSPNPRLVLFPDHLYISRSLRKTIKQRRFRVTIDTAFQKTIVACAAPRAKQSGTWITSDIKRAYSQLHELGWAHSVEVWDGQDLVGGLYGIAIGQVFFGESMFSTQTDASKVAFVYLTKNLQQWGYALIDCQVRTEHLVSLGAEEIPRKIFIQELHKHVKQAPLTTAWQSLQEPEL